MHVAVLGTGAMGSGIARSLLRSGFNVTVWNRTKEKAVPLADDGAVVAESAATAVVEADAVITVLFDEEAVAATAHDFLPHVKTGSVWLQTATVGPAGAQRLADLADKAGVPMVDAPVVGTKEPAEAGTLTVLASGPGSAVQAASPVFEAIGTKTVEVGESIGAASALKLACNAWIASMTAGAGQSLMLAKSLGVDPALFLSTIKGGPSDSAYAQLKGKMMISGSFSPSFSLGGLMKDIDLMLSATADTDFDDSFLRAARSYYLAAIAVHGADKDVAAVVTSFRPSDQLSPQPDAYFEHGWTSR
jgi:3-hydroxyisobutyrate dehydrogenase